MRIRNAAPLVLLLIASALPALSAPPTYPCYRPSVAPVIDGDIASDPAWRNIPAVADGEQTPLIHDSEADGIG